MSDQRVDEVVQDRPLLQTEGVRDAEQTLDEAAALLTVAAEGALAFDYRRTQGPLRRVVRRLQPVVPRERPQRRLQLEDRGAHPGRLRAAAGRPLLQQGAQPPVYVPVQPASAACPVAHLVPK